MDSDDSTFLRVTLVKQTPLRQIALFPPIGAAALALASPLLGCGPLRHTPSAVQPAVFYCRANKWGASEGVSVYRLPIWSLFQGVGGKLSLGDGQSLGFIDFFPSPLLCQRRPNGGTLKTSATVTAQAASAAAAPSWWSTTALFFFFFYPPLKGKDEDERQREWKMIGETQSKASPTPPLPLPPLTLISLSPPSILTQRKYCTLSDSH